MENEKINKLTKLKELLDAGVLTQEEFTKEKTRIINDDGQEQRIMNETKVTETKVVETPDGSNTLLLLQIGSLIVTVVMFILFFVSYDPVAFGIIGFIFAIITIVISWIKKTGINKTYAIISSVVAGVLGLIMLITP